MTCFVTLVEAKANLSALVERANAGEEIIITKNGNPRARLMPLAGQMRRPSAQARKRAKRG